MAIRRIRRREFLATLGSALAWPVVARGQQPSHAEINPALVGLAKELAAPPQGYAAHAAKAAKAAEVAKRKIFISYRRENDAGHAGWISNLSDLEREFDIFMDVDTIRLGTDFVEAINEAVAKCDVLIALIGRSWLDLRDEAGDRRLDNPNDFVRLEIAAALQRQIPVIPILIDGAKIPNAAQLPADVQQL